MNLLEKGVKYDDIVHAFHNKEMPLTIVPKGLTPARAQYLYDKVRKNIHCQSNRDKVCPKPSPFEKSNTVNPNVIRQGIMERERYNRTIMS